MATAIHLADSERDALYNLLCAYLVTEEVAEDLPQLRAVRDKIREAWKPTEWIEGPGGLRISREDFERMPKHTQDCALVTTHHLTCTCGAYNRQRRDPTI